MQIIPEDLPKYFFVILYKQKAEIDVIKSVKTTLNKERSKYKKGLKKANIQI